MLWDKNLPHFNKKFGDLAGNIENLNTDSEIAEQVAKYREEIFGVLKNNEAEGTIDQAKLKNLMDKLCDKRSLLMTTLGKAPDNVNYKFDFSSNDGLKSFWERIINAKTIDTSGNVTRDIDKIDSSGRVTDQEKNDMIDKIKKVLKNLQFLHVDWQGKQQNWKLFGGRSTNMADIQSTLNDGYIKDLLNANSNQAVENAVDEFVKSVRKTGGNAFHIQHSKFYYMEEKETAVRVAGYLYLIWKIVDEDVLTNDLYNEINSVIDSQIVEYEIPKLKGLHNIERELGWVNAEYDTLYDLNLKSGDENLGNKDLSSGVVIENRNLKSDFETPNTKAVNLEKYEIETSKIEIEDNNGNLLNVKLNDGTRNISSLFAEIGNTKDANILINISGEDIKIGKLVIDNISGNPKFSIEFEDRTSLEAQASNAGITLSSFPLKFGIKLKGIKKIKALGLTSAASLTKNYIGELNLGTTSGGNNPGGNNPGGNNPGGNNPGGNNPGGNNPGGNNPGGNNPGGNNPGGNNPPSPIEIGASISDMGSDVLKEKVALDIEEKLRREYKAIAKGNVLKRFKFFWKRGVYRNKMIKKKMEQMSGKPFTGDMVIDEQTSNATDRHQLEKEGGINDNIKNIGKRHNVVLSKTEINELCRRFLGGHVSDDQFKNEFNTIIESDTRLKRQLDKAGITHMGTNILLKMKQQLAWRLLIKTIQTNITQYLSSNADSYIQNINSDIGNYIKTFQDNSTQLATLFDDYQNDRTNTIKLQSLQNFLSHEESRMNLGLSNLTVKLDIIKGGKSAYQINNRKREGWMYKIGNLMDKHPIWSGIGTLGAGAAAGLATGPIGTTALVASIIGITNYVRKHTHLTKEQKTHEKQLVSDYDKTMRKVSERQNTLSNGKWLSYKRYKAKRQLKLYNETTQNDIKITNTVTDTINSISSKVGSLTPLEVDELKYNLIEGWARLKYYNKIGHNFLASKEKAKTEEDMNKLEKSLFLGIKKLGSTSGSLQDIEHYRTFILGRSMSFNDIYKELKDNFKQSNKRFKRRRRRLAIKYGLTTAAISAVSSLGIQRLTNTGYWAKGTDGVAGYSSGPNTYSDTFGLGQHELLDTGTQNNIYTGTKNTIKLAPSGSEVSIHYGGGTDATPFLPGNTPTASDLSTKISDVTDNIKGMAQLTRDQKDLFISEVRNLSGGKGTNGILQNMRHAEFLEQSARALADSGKAEDVAISLVHDSRLDVAGTQIHNKFDRVVNGSIAVFKQGVEAEPPINRWWYGMPTVPTFFGTYEDEKNAA